MNRVKEIFNAFLHLIFPHVCAGCGSDLPDRFSFLCMRCAGSLPQTEFELFRGNPVEKRFYGRLPLQNASSQFYFSKESLVQHLVHQLKYKGNRELGWQLGSLMGHSLRRSGRFDADALVPLPLFPVRERKRGYNQAMVLCEGVAEQLNIPVYKDVICRPQSTDTQTRKGRIERWNNIEGKFVLTQPEKLKDKHILLIDDVITTGATLESCGTELLKSGCSLSVASLCVAWR